MAFVGGIQRVPVNSPYKWPVTRKIFGFDDVIMTGNKMTYMYEKAQFPVSVTKCAVYKLRQSKSASRNILEHLK